MTVINKAQNEIKIADGTWQSKAQTNIKVLVKKAKQTTVNKNAFKYSILLSFK